MPSATSQLTWSRWEPRKRESTLRLAETESYVAHGLDVNARDCLELLGDLLLSSQTNLTAIKEPLEVERLHFLDSLSLVDLPTVRGASRIVDVGSGAGFPALVLAIALPGAELVALESNGRKCAFVQQAAAELGLSNVSLECARAEDYGRGLGRGLFDVAVSRALASLAVVAELSLPLCKLGGAMVAMKGSMSDQERTQGERALAILGADRMDVVRLHPFVGAENRWVCISVKRSETGPLYPRRPGIPVKRPLGAGSDGGLR
jgi:16S rRNA (guanine527-N7)-methyltransferase